VANRRDIKRRISSVINTQKITRAMKLVAAAKFARAAQAVNAAKPYSKALQDVCSSVIGKAESRFSHSRVESNTVLLVVIATDRGLCGGLNTNLFKKIAQWQNQNHNHEVHAISIGRKAKQWLKLKGIKNVAHYERLLDRPSVDDARIICSELISKFDEYSQIFLASNEFVNALTQTPKVELFLPFFVEESNTDVPESSQEFLSEPGIAQMLDPLIERQLRTRIFQAFLDSAASEHGSRMTAMDSATNNASEVRKKLTLKYNRVRQAAITKELIEIISGAEAL
jgi:F-type H+-transporting ATPase subunit gamma